MRRLAPALLAACAGGQDPVAALVARYPAEPEAVRAELGELGDPVLQEAAVVALAEAYPGQTAALCAALPQGGARWRCERFNSRPHLWTIAPDEQGPTIGSRPGGGPSDARIRLSGIAAPLDAVAADPGSCGQDHLCLSQQAQQAAAQGSAAQAAARCRALESPRLRADCFFVSAEAVPADPGRYGDALDLCLGAAAFAPECLGHVTKAFAGGRLRGGVRSGREARELGQEIAAAWRERAPEKAEEAVDLYWSNYCTELLPLGSGSVAQAAAVLPAEAGPHLRDAAALFAIGQAEPVRAAADLLAGVLPAPLQHGQCSRGVLWPGDLPGEEQIPATFFSRSCEDRRPTDPDPDVDLRLAVLTAAAHESPPRLDLVERALDSGERLERWTAVRLLAALRPEHPALPALRDDPEPLVRQRVGAALGFADMAAPPPPEASP